MTTIQHPAAPENATRYTPAQADAALTRVHRDHYFRQYGFSAEPSDINGLVRIRMTKGGRLVGWL